MKIRMLVTGLALVLAAAGAAAQSAPPPAAALQPPAEPWPPAGVFKVEPGITSPAVIKEVHPKYTADARRAKIQGAVEVEAIVRTDGRISEARILRSLDKQFGLDEAAIDAVKQWRFRPGMKDGEAVPVLVRIELTFQVR